MGELEIIVTAEMLNKTNVVINEREEVIPVHNDTYARQLEHTLMLRFVAIEENTGHYEAVVVSHTDDDIHEKSNDPVTACFHAYDNDSLRTPNGSAAPPSGPSLHESVSSTQWPVSP